MTLRWIRRTRLDGDGWEPAEVPLGEEREAYEVDILSGSTAIRTLSASRPEALYPAADEIADFGVAQAALDRAGGADGHRRGARFLAAGHRRRGLRTRADPLPLRERVAAEGRPGEGLSRLSPSSVSQHRASF